MAPYFSPIKWIASTCESEYVNHKVDESEVPTNKFMNSDISESLCIFRPMKFRISSINPVPIALTYLYWKRVPRQLINNFFLFLISKSYRDERVRLQIIITIVRSPAGWNEKDRK